MQGRRLNQGVLSKAACQAGGFGTCIGKDLTRIKNKFKKVTGNTTIKQKTKFGIDSHTSELSTPQALWKCHPLP